MTDSKKVTSRVIDEKFEREAMVLGQISGVSVMQVIEELSVSSLLYRWILKYRDVQQQAERPSYEKLEKELR
ncbi:MAG: hypothetical protein F4X56_01000 [Gammaproteobacteria bacterium]|nr:hypothetical protein [Gammaproteobacteria bacterium]